MRINLEGSVVNIKGDVTLDGMTHELIQKLSGSLELLESRDEVNINVDCRRVRRIDIDGIRLLDVWMQCARYMGVNPELVNLPEHMKLAIKDVIWS